MLQCLLYCQRPTTHYRQFVPPPDILLLLPVVHGTEGNNAARYSTLRTA
jgi:hypothetical protein